MTRRLFFAAISPAIVRAQTIQEKGRKIIAESIAAMGGALSCWFYKTRQPRET